MKKKIWIPIILAIIAIAILFVPIPVSRMKDGGTRVYSALTYKIVKWQRITDYGVYRNTRVYYGADRWRDIDYLWSKEWKNEERLEYTDEWLDKTVAEKQRNDVFSDIIITEIYSNCFFANTVIPMPYQIKLNGTLSNEWCVGDQVICTYENTYYDKSNHRFEADLLSIAQSTFAPDPDVCYKPVIYLYPQEKSEVSVKLKLNGDLTCTYPSYNNGWRVTAFPNGTLTDENGQEYNYLYWEGEAYAQYDLSKGFCIKGKDTAQFLETALERLGLNRREANEFIVYWLPLMQENAYNIISFQSDAYTHAAHLEIEPVPDTLIRVFMTYQPSDVYIEIPPQELSSPRRNGFTVIEWGGTEISTPNYN